MARLVRFGVFEVDLQTGELRRQGVRVRLQEQAFKILTALLERPGEVVGREEIRAQLWPPDIVVDFEHSLNKAVNKLREALGDSADNPRFIETLPRRGYRFIAPVVALDAAGAEPAPQKPESRRRLWPLALGAALVLAAGTYALRVRPREGPMPSPSRVMLVVLPFQNLSGQADQEYLSDGMTEEMIAELGRLHPQRLGVIARTSAMQYKDTAKRVDEIGRELGVQYLLEGSVRRTAGRVRITAQLVRLTDQTHLWAETYERDLTDVFAIQSEVARRIAGSLTLELLPPAREALARPHTRSAAAHEHYLQGRFLWSRRTEEGLRKSLEHFRQATLADPDYALGHVGLADAYNLLADYGLEPPNEVLPQSKAAALKALDLNPSLAEAHASLGWVTLVYDRDFVAAEQSFEHALALNPGYASAHQWYAYCLKAVGRDEEALAEIRRAQEVDPLSLIIHAVVGWHHYLAGDYDQAIDQCRRVIAMDPSFPRVYSYLGWAFLMKGRYPEALVALAKAKELFGDNPARLAELGHGYAVAGHRQEARRILDELAVLSKRRYVESDLIARIHGGLGERDRAFSWLDRALEEHAVKLVLLKIDPSLQPLRGDPRFADLLRRAGFAP